MAMISLALTLGEPSGIGPDICLELLKSNNLCPAGCKLVIIADPTVLEQRASVLGMDDYKLPIEKHLTPQINRFPTISVWPVSRVRNQVIPGHLDKNNANYVLQTLKFACMGCRDEVFNAMITGPVHKGIINDSGTPFTGHTEFLAQETGTKRSVMLLSAETIRVALLTTHLPLADVSKAINFEDLVNVLRILDQYFKKFFSHGKSPKIAVLGLNPHAGEGGYLGREEIEIITPAINKACSEGIDTIGPWPGDTAFLPEKIKSVDIILAMYHDQGLIVPKHIAFDQTTNITLGLPIIRTSVDHGVALELAGSGKSNAGSLKAAINMAATMVKNSNKLPSQ